MKQIVAIVKPFLAEQVLEALRHAPLEALNVREVKGYGRQKSYLDQYSETEYSQAFLPKVEITLWVDDARVDDLTRFLIDTAGIDAALLRRVRVKDKHAFVEVPEADADAVIAKIGATTWGERAVQAERARGK